MKYHRQHFIYFKDKLHLLRFAAMFAFFLGVIIQGVAQSSPNSTEAECIELIEKSKYFGPRDLDSALVYARQARTIAEQINSDKLNILVLINFGDVYKDIGNSALAFDYYLQSHVKLDKIISEQPDNPELKLLHIDVQMKEGILHNMQGNDEKSLSYYEQGLVLLEQLKGKVADGEIQNRKLKLFNNIAVVYMRQEAFDTALTYFLNALEVNKYDNNAQFESSICNNMGICYMEKGAHDMASHYFLKSLSLREASDDKRGQAQVLNNIGKNHVLTGRFEESRAYYLKALQLGREIGNGESVLRSLESLSLLYDTLGEYKPALDKYKEFKALNDSMFGYETKIAISRLQDSYNRDKEEKIFELEAKRIEAERQKTEIRNLSFGIVLVALLLISLLVIVLMRGKIKNGVLHQEKLQLERQKLEVEHQALQERVEYKDRELTANALYRLKNNELITKITENLLRAKSTFKEENQKTIQSIITELSSSQDTQVWSEFEAHFTRVHSSFYDKLQLQFPNLSANERKLCAFLRLNMSTKDISAITNQSVNSITVARSRLRKKLNIEGEEVNLINFLSQI